MSPGVTNTNKHIANLNSHTESHQPHIKKGMKSESKGRGEDRLFTKGKRLREKLRQMTSWERWFNLVEHTNGKCS